jgi:hypothetical protein
MVLFIMVCRIAILSGLTTAHPEQKYVFILDTERYVGLRRDGAILLGKLDKNGEFSQEHRIEATGNDGMKMILYSGPSYELLNDSIVVPGPIVLTRKVYEFRSGMLIPGEIQADGRFVPEEGGKITKFKDYEYTPTATPIWNLPGRFVTKDEATKLMQPKPADKK